MGKQTKIKMVAGPVWRETLTVPQSRRIRSIHATMGEEVLGPFEWFEAKFLRELKLDQKIQTYERIAHAFVVWKKDNRQANLQARKAVVIQMLIYTMSGGKMMKGVAPYFKAG